MFGRDYKSYADQLKWAIGELIAETEKLIEIPTKAAYEKFHAALTSIDSDKALAASLSQIIVHYGDFTQRVLLTANFDGPSVQEIEIKPGKNFDDSTRLGIVYLLRGDVQNAEKYFAGSHMRIDSLMAPVNAVYNNISDAVRIIQNAYSRIPKQLKMPQ